MEASTFQVQLVLERIKTRSSKSSAPVLNFALRNIFGIILFTFALSTLRKVCCAGMLASLPFWEVHVSASYLISLLRLPPSQSSNSLLSLRVRRGARRRHHGHRLRNDRRYPISPRAAGKCWTCDLVNVLLGQVSDPSQPCLVDMLSDTVFGENYVIS